MVWSRSGCSSVPHRRQLPQRDAHELRCLPVGDAESPGNPALERITADVRTLVVLSQQAEPPGYAGVHVRSLLRELRLERR